MKKSVLKGSVLFASMVALAAFAVPTMASAAIWGPGGTNGALDSSYLSVNNSSAGFGWGCQTHLGIHVRTPGSATLDVTSATFSACSGTGSMSGCGITAAATGLPWTAQAVSTSNITLTIPNVNVTFTGPCPFGVGTLNLSGTLGTGGSGGGVWSAASHTVSFTNTTGLTIGAGGVPWYSVTTTGALRNPTQTLTLI